MPPPPIAATPNQVNAPATQLFPELYQLQQTTRAETQAKDVSGETRNPNVEREAPQGSNGGNGGVRLTDLLQIGLAVIGYQVEPNKLFAHFLTWLFGSKDVADASKPTDKKSVS
jgi:hypothetical protein